MRVLVTGANGFVGSHVVALLPESVEVAALVRPAGSQWRLDGLARSPHLIRADLSDRKSLRVGLKAWPPDVCIHLAWYAEPGRYLEATENLDCLRSGLDLVELLAEVGCSHLVATGTCFEYALESVEGPLAEGSRLGPNSLYAASKLALCFAAAARARQLGLGFAWARLFYLYGPGEDPRRLLPAALAALLDGRDFPATAGEQVRDYLHVDDVAAGLVALATGRTAGTYNISSGEPLRIRDLLETAADLTGGRRLLRFGATPYRDWDPMYICGNSDSLRAATGWFPRVPLREGIRTTIEWWAAQRDPSLTEVTP